MDKSRYTGTRQHEVTERQAGHMEAGFGHICTYTYIYAGIEDSIGTDQ